MEISRFPCKRLRRMPGSTTTRGRHAFCGTENVSTPNLSYAAQYLAYASPMNASRLPSRAARASLGDSAVRYSFTVTDFHRLPFAGLPAHPSTTSLPDIASRARYAGSPPKSNIYGEPHADFVA